MIRQGSSPTSPNQPTGELQSVAVVRVENRQFLIPAGLLRHHCPALAPALKSNAPLIRVNIDGMKSQTFKLIESYIRVGQLPDVTVQNVIDLYTAAINLGMQKLASKCHERIYTSCVEDQALIYYIECQRNHSAVDITAALIYMAKTFRMIALSKGITEISEEQLIRLVDSNPIKQRPQSERFTAVLRWLQADCKVRRDRAKGLLARFDLSDKALVGCEVCPEIGKQVPALKLLAKAGPSTLKNDVPLHLRSGDTKSLTLTGRLATVPTISGGSTVVSPTSGSAFTSKTSVKRPPKIKVPPVLPPAPLKLNKPKVPTGKSTSSTLLSASRSSSCSSQASTVDSTGKKRLSKDAPKQGLQAVPLKKTGTDLKKGKACPLPGTKVKDLKKPFEDKIDISFQMKKKTQAKAPGDSKKPPVVPPVTKKVSDDHVNKLKKMSPKNVPVVKNVLKNTDSLGTGQTEGSGVGCDGTVSKTDTYAVGKTSTDTGKSPGDRKVSVKMAKKPSAAGKAGATAVESKKSPDKKGVKDDKKASGKEKGLKDKAKLPGDLKKSPAEKGVREMKKSPGAVPSTTNKLQTGVGGKAVVVEGNKPQIDQAGKGKKPALDKSAQSAKALEGKDKEKVYGDKPVQPKKVPGDGKQKVLSISELKAPPFVSPLPDSVKLKHTGKAAETVGQKQVAKVENNQAKVPVPNAKKLDEEYSAKRMAKLAEARAKLFAKEGEDSSSEEEDVDEDTDRRRGAARFYKEDEKIGENEAAAESSARKFQEVVQRSPRKALIRWPKLRKGEKDVKQKDKAVPSRSKKIWMNIKKEVRVLAGGRQSTKDQK